MVEKVFEMTYDGIKKLQDELDNRKTTVAAEIAERLKEARALGDLSENSEYDDAKEAQAENEVRIMEIEAILKNEFPGVEILIHPDPEGHVDPTDMSSKDLLAKL